MITGAPTPDRVNREDDSEGASSVLRPTGAPEAFFQAIPEVN
jgi:hypothetical protein